MNFLNKNLGSSFFSMMILLMTCTLLLNLIVKNIIHLNDHYSARKSLFCIKKYNIAQKKLITKINWANKIIRTIKVTDTSIKIFSIFVPGLGVLKLGTKSAITYLKNYQQISAFAFLKKRAELAADNCKIITTLNLMPYKWKSLKFLRDATEAVVLKDRSWTQTIISRKIMIRTKVKLKSSFQTKPHFQSSLRKKNIMDFPLW